MKKLLFLLFSFALAGSALTATVADKPVDKAKPTDKPADKPVLTLCEAAKIGDMPTATTLLENGTKVDDPDEKGKTPLMWAADGGGDNATNIVRILIHFGADVNTKDKEGLTVLGRLQGPRTPALPHDALVAQLKIAGAHE